MHSNPIKTVIFLASGKLLPNDHLAFAVFLAKALHHNIKGFSQHNDFNSFFIENVNWHAIR
jgi:hypothetical protein